MIQLNHGDTFIKRFDVSTFQYHEFDKLTRIY